MTSKLIVGLGNPGKRYEGTRHNIGFEVLEVLARSYGVVSWNEDSHSRAARISTDRGVLFLLMPLTFMNLSGQAVAACAKFYKIAPGDMTVIHDEIDLPLGCIRIKSGGGDGGHNGIKSIVECLGSKDFLRIRCGVGRPPADRPMEVAQWVLSRFTSDELTQRGSMVTRSAEAAKALLEDSLKTVQNKFNVGP